MILKIGSTETEAVKAVQRKLGLKDDGDFGGLTESAVKSFQAKNGLSVDGSVGNETAAKMGIDLTTFIVVGYKLTMGTLKLVTGINNVGLLAEITRGLNLTLEKYNINTPLRVSHFLAQLLHESMNLTVTKENLNYSAKALATTFKKYFQTLASTEPYARQPNKIANKVYANRMGNGPTESNDGAFFCGRGYIQLTGRDNYTAFSKNVEIDFLSNPELLETPKYASLSAGWYWNRNNINKLADKDDIIAITKSINGGLNGLDDRKANLTKIKKYIK